MEWVNGEIWANVWQTECLARIDPADGTVVGWVLLQGLGHRERQAHPKHRMDVLNGAARCTSKLTQLPAPAQRHIAWSVVWDLVWRAGDPDRLPAPAAVQELRGTRRGSGCL